MDEKTKVREILSVIQPQTEAKGSNGSLKKILNKICMVLICVNIIT